MSEQEGDALAGAERVEVRHHRVRQQQGVAAHELALAEHRPAAEQARDHARIAALARGDHLVVDGGQRLGGVFVLHGVPGDRKTKYTAPMMHSAAHR